MGQFLCTHCKNLAQLQSQAAKLDFTYENNVKLLKNRPLIGTADIYGQIRDAGHSAAKRWRIN